MTDLRDDRDFADFTPIPAKGAARSPRRWLIAHAVAWGAWLIVLTVVERKFEAIFQDFGVDLPGMTVLVIKVGHTGMLLAPLLLIVLGADWVVLNTMDRRGEARGHRAWAIAMLIAPLLLFGATIVALVIPLISLETRLSG